MPNSAPSLSRVRISLEVASAHARQLSRSSLLLVRHHLRIRSISLPRQADKLPARPAAAWRDDVENRLLAAVVGGDSPAAGGHRKRRCVARARRTGRANAVVSPTRTARSQRRHVYVPANTGG